MKFIKFPSIDQFRTIVKNVRTTASFVGLDDDGEPIYDGTHVKPVIKFIGTVKLHGTNAGVCYDGENIWAQKRTGNITVEKDNMGFAFFVESNREVFKKLFDSIFFVPGEKVVIYGEWCGAGIQKGVALSQLEKMFVIFDVKIIDAEGEGHWLLEEKFYNLHSNENKIYNIHQFPTFELHIDFNNPEVAQMEMIKITENVEEECPVGRYFGVSGTGEGVVWRALHNDSIHRFKVKGEKHSTSKVKTLAPIDIEKLKSVEAFIEYAATENRLNQGIEMIFTSNNLDLDIRKMGDFLRWVMGDICKEEMDTMKENSLEPKDISRAVSNYGRNWFMNKLNNV